MAYVAKPSCCGLDSRFMLAFPRKKQKDIGRSEEFFCVWLLGRSEEIFVALAKQNHCLNGKLEI